MIEIGSALDKGRKRSGSENQDALFVVHPSLFYWRPTMLVVADGMGGYDGGAIASQVVVSNFSGAYTALRHDRSPLLTMEEAVSLSMEALKKQAEQNSNLDKMGSTVVAAVVRGSKIYLINVGDSRAYLINHNGIEQISQDHSLVGEFIRHGLITQEEARVHPRRNVLSMSITAQRDGVEPFTGVFHWRRGDALLLCSDGLWGPVTDAQIQAVVMEYPPQQAADKLVELANANQGPDNISVIIALYR
jgi:PPM family protein phosphatase